MINKEFRNKLVVILGQTASGKTELAIKLAKKFNGEVVSADSRQVYKEMDIGTGKIAKKEMQGIPHRLLDVVKPNQEFNAAVYKKMAVKAIKDIQKKGRVPFLAGGTGLYIKAVVDNLSFIKVPAQKKIRKDLEKKDAEQLFKIYKKLDPRGAKFIEKKNKRRLIRAIEVCKATKKPFWRQRKKGSPIFDVLEIGIKISKEKLEKRISKRTDGMIKSGLEKEVKKLVKKYGWEIAPLQTIGYQEWKPYFNKETTKKQVKENIKLHTVQFARRQMTWFKRDKRIEWTKNCLEAKKIINKFLSK